MEAVKKKLVERLLPVITIKRTMSCPIVTFLVKYMPELVRKTSSAPGCKFHDRKALRELGDKLSVMLVKILEGSHKKPNRTLLTEHLLRRYYKSKCDSCPIEMDYSNLSERLTLAGRHAVLQLANEHGKRVNTDGAEFLLAVLLLTIRSVIEMCSWRRSGPAAGYAAQNMLASFR